MDCIREVLSILNEALCYRCIDKNDLAIDDCNKCIEINPKSELPYILKGIIDMLI